MPESQSHRCSLSETNGHNIVPLCSCRWIGAIHLPPTHMDPQSKRTWRDVDAAQRDAKREHQTHVRAALTVDAEQ